MWRRPLLTAFLSAIIALPAWAFERPFPQDAKRGTMTPAPYPAIIIDGKQLLLSPGARIWNKNNMIDMPASLRGSDIVVNYTANGQGEIDRIWILTDDEAGKPIDRSTNSLFR